jgi:hypothetical protein
MYTAGHTNPQALHTHGTAVPSSDLLAVMDMHHAAWIPHPAPSGPAVDVQRSLIKR